MHIHFEEIIQGQKNEHPVYLIHTLPLDRNYLLNSIPNNIEINGVGIDLPGFGKSLDIEEEDFTFKDMAYEINLLRQKLNHDKIIILGHGVGGFVAIEYVLEFPESTKGVILVNSAGNAKYRNAMAWNIREKYSKITIQALEQYKGQVDDKSIRARFTQSLATYFNPTNHKLAKQLMDNSDRIGSEAYVHISHRLLPHVDYRSRLRNINLPVLVIASTKDVWPETASQLIRNDIIHASYSEFETGHFPMIENPEKFWKRISEFVKM